jgi:hypothetical protein
LSLPADAGSSNFWLHTKIPAHWALPHLRIFTATSNK